MNHYPFPNKSLMEWTPANEEFVGALINGFKGGWSIQAAFIFAELLCFQESKEACEDLVNPVFVAPPARGRMDHATVLAAALADRWQAPLLTGLKNAPGDIRGDERGQKMKSSQERAERRFEWSGPPLGPGLLSGGDGKSDPGAETTYIFVDDVITSGATAMAAFMALGDPSRFLVWTIARRPKLAGKAAL